jgi:hypothetical protein
LAKFAENTERKDFTVVLRKLPVVERVKGTCRLKTNSPKIKKIIFGQLCVLYLYFVAPTLALGQPLGLCSSSPLPA